MGNIRKISLLSDLNARTGTKMKGDDVFFKDPWIHKYTWTQSTRNQKLVIEKEFEDKDQNCLQSSLFYLFTLGKKLSRSSDLVQPLVFEQFRETLSFTLSQSTGIDDLLSDFCRVLCCKLCLWGDLCIRESGSYLRFHYKFVLCVFFHCVMVTVWPSLHGLMSLVKVVKELFDC